MHKLPFSQTHVKTEIPFHQVHSDVCGPSHFKSIDGYRYFVTFIDKCICYLWISPLYNKSEVFSKFLKFYEFFHNQFNAHIKCFQSDGDEEYRSKVFIDFLESKGIVHQFSCPYTFQQNGLAERKNQHLIETTITLLTTTSLPGRF